MARHTMEANILPFPNVREDKCLCGRNKRGGGGGLYLFRELIHGGQLVLHGQALDEGQRVQQVGPLRPGGGYGGGVPRPAGHLSDQHVF